MKEEILKKIPVDKIYNDALSPAMKQLGSALENTTRAARFVLAPVEYVAAHHKRWERYLKRISEKVEDKNFIEGHPQVVIPSLEGLVLSYEKTLLSEFFINLLANSVDKTKQDLAHPAFPKIIQQLSHDEAVVLYYLKKKSYKLKQEIDFDHSKHLFTKERIIENEFPLGKLQFPQNFFLYMDHLHSLNIAGSWQVGNQKIIKDKKTDEQVGVHKNNSIKLTTFGKLFVEACVPDKFKI